MVVWIACAGFVQEGVAVDLVGVEVVGVGVGVEGWFSLLDGWGGGGGVVDCFGGSLEEEEVVEEGCF